MLVGLAGIRDVSSSRAQKGKTKFRVLSPSVINNFLNSALISFSAVPLRIALLLGVVVILFDLALLFTSYSRNSKEKLSWMDRDHGRGIIHGVFNSYVWVFWAFIYIIFMNRSETGPTILLNLPMGFHQMLMAGKRGSTLRCILKRRFMKILILLLNVDYFIGV